jgi:hypothetical protein
VKKNTFVIHLNEDTAVDIALMTDNDLNRIKQDAAWLESTGKITDPNLASIAAFIVYLKDVETLTDIFNPDVDKYM